MQQLSLFPESGTEEIPVDYQPDFLTQREADDLLSYSLALNWKQNDITMRGETIQLPRREYIAGDEGCEYLYSNSVLLEPVPWCPPLLKLREKVEEATGYIYHIAIGNRYDCGSDSIGWHDDLNKAMPPMAAIASITVGHERKFQLRFKEKGSQIHEYWLTHGSLILMQPGCQVQYKHQIPKTTKEVSVRVKSI